MKRKQIIGLAAAVVIFAASFLIHAADASARSGVTALAMAIALLVIILTKALHPVIACLICIVLMPLTGITDGFAGALSGFATRVPIFILAALAFAEAYAKVPISKRVLMMLLRSFGKDVRTVLLVMMLGAALLSSITSTMATCAIFMAIALSLLDLYRDDAQRQRAGRAFMVGIPVASMIGSMMTPVGSSLNMYAITMLEKLTGNSISFVQWLCAGIPLAIFALPAAWYLILVLFRPAEVEPGTMRSFINSLAVPDEVGAQEKKVLIVTAAMIVLWIASSWINALDVAMVSVLGACVFFLPGVRILDMKTFLRDVDWSPMFLAGTLLSLANAIAGAGTINAIAGLLKQPHIAAVPAVAICAVFTFILLALLSSAPIIMVIAAPLLCAFSAACGLSPAVGVMTLGLCACNNYLRPRDSVTRLTFETGYYTPLDMIKVTLPLQIWLVILISLWVPVVGKICKFI
ncbi:MAG: anion permease [Oscillospiraceae bacterium]|nr:anion permease [Oscillospiraceae bacterium]